MTLLAHPDEPLQAHIAELRLRRFRTGELAGAEREDVASHTALCGACRARLKTLEDEQRHFEREMAFERFAGGVERARRVARRVDGARVRSFGVSRRVWAAGGAAIAAAAGLVLLLRAGPGAIHEDRANRIKGAADHATIQIAAPGGAQRASGAVEPLRPGERLRIGYRTARARHLVALSVDGAGVVSALYPESGPGLPVEPRAETAYLPDSFEFTGHGPERLFLLLADEPLDVERAVHAARAAYRRVNGDLRAFPPLEVDKSNVRQFSWLFEKP